MYGANAAEIRWPRALAPGDHIRVVAPASGFPREAFETGVGMLEARGYRVSWRPDLFERQHYVAGSVARRLDELHEAFTDPSIQAVLCARGGYGSMQLLTGLDFSVIERHPKVFVGCSDLTPLLNICVQDLNFVAYHGPVVAGLHRTRPESLTQLFALLEGRAWRPGGEARAEESSLPARIWASPGGTVRPGRVTARLCGGNLSMLAATLGTPFEIVTQDRIVCLEDVGERPYRLDRLLTQLKLAGKLHQVAGVAFGSFTDCAEPGGGGRPVEAVLHEAVADLECPVLSGLPFGHGPENDALPLGALATLDADAGWLGLHLPTATAGNVLPSVDALIERSGTAV